MTSTDPGRIASDTASLLRSLHASIRRLREQADLLCEELAAEIPTDLGQSTRQLAALDGLIRTCQKAETTLVQYCIPKTPGADAPALDLVAARKEIAHRLSRIRDAANTGVVSE